MAAQNNWLEVYSPLGSGLTSGLGSGSARARDYFFRALFGFAL